MGDRGNIVVKQYGDHGYIYLYSHWGGYGMPQTLQRALAKRWRWTDESYLARIIFDEMSAGSHGAATSFGITTYLTGHEYGITTYLTGHEYDLLVVDAHAQEVRLVKEPEWDGDAPPDFEHPLARWSFEEYIALSLGEEGWEVLKGAVAS